MDLVDRIKKLFRSQPGNPDTAAPVVQYDQLPAAYSGQKHIAGWEGSVFDGEKFFGGMGPVQAPWVDYWSLRQRSCELFMQNPYAAGIVKRLVTSEINTGLSPEVRPEEIVLGFEEGSLSEWGEDVENRFALWGDREDICDYFGKDTFSALQYHVRREALISGDVLVVMGQDKRARVPNVQLIDADRVRSPLVGDSEKIPESHEVRHGVERDARGREVAYWVQQGDLGFKRIRARSARNGRRIAWLVFGSGSDRYGDERGLPLLALVMQSLKESDRYKDSVLRKAVINSMLALFVKKSDDKPGTLPLQQGAVRRGSVTERQNVGTDRKFNVASQIPGLVLDELQKGEEPMSFGSGGTDEKFGEFEEAIVHGVAWALEIPPEILTLNFSSNYSASQAATNEFKTYLGLVRARFGTQFCDPIYRDWLLSEVLNGKVSAQGFLDAWRDRKSYEQYAAWVAADWYGPVKLSTDMLKQANASEKMLQLGLSTHAREARNMTGTKFSKNVRRLQKEKQMLAEAGVLPDESEETQPKKGDNEDE